MSDRKNIESSKIEGLIPRQLVEDSQALVTFLKEYYNFLNEEGGASYALNTLLQNRDVDTAVDDFLTLIHNEIGTGFAKEIRTLEADKNNLYKHIKEFYSCKGSLDSFQTLFKLLFNTNVEIILPKEQILIASDGRWSQQESFFIEASSGDPLDLYGNIITVVSNQNFIDVEVERIRKVYPAQDYYEIFITRNVNTNRIEVGATFSFNGIAGTVIDSLGNIELIYAGQNFEVPQFVDIDYQSTGTLIRISEVTASGGIQKFKIISFGIGYTNDFYARVVPRSEIVGDDLIVIDEEDIDTEIASNPTHAIIKFSNAAIAQYTGEFTNNKGFLSDDIYLQDNYYYQQYSYVIKSGLQIETYRNIVNKTVHPAGMIFFGQFEITNEFDLAQNIQSIGRFLRARLQSQFSVTDLFTAYFEKLLESSVTPAEEHVVDYSKNLLDVSNVTPAERKYVDYSKNTSSDVSTSFTRSYDFDKPLASSAAVTESLAYDFDKPTSSSVSTSFVVEKEIEKDIESSVAATSVVNITTNYNRFFTSSVTAFSSNISYIREGGVIGSSSSAIDNSTINLEKALSSSINTTDSAIAYINPYSLGYFAETYTEGSYSLT